MLEMLEPISLYHSPSPRLVSTSNASPKSSTPSVVPETQSAADPLPDPLSETRPSSTSSGGSENPTPSPKVKAKRAARACDVCRNNHRKCPGPAPGSESCQRCIRQHKVCTWNEHKARMARQASASPRTTKTRKTSFRRSKSAPSVQPTSYPQHVLPPSASPPISSTNDEESAPATPADDYNSHPCSTKKVAEVVTLGEMPSCNAQESLRQHTAQAQALPEWYVDTLAVANKHNLLFFPMCLDSWEERHLRNGPVPNVGLRCVVPSYIDPPPTTNEAMDMLDLLLLEMRTFPAASSDMLNPGLITVVEPASSQEKLIETPVSSDEEPHPRVDSDDSASEQSASGPIGSSPSPLPPSTEDDLNNLVAADDDDDASMSEPEPEFSYDTSTDSSSRDTMLPQRLKSEPAGFDPFLYSPCNCLTGPAQGIGTSPTSMDTDESTNGGARKFAQALWDEGMPDVLTNASNEAALDQCLRIGETLSLN